MTESNIKGYHVFKRRPHSMITMAVQKDEGNDFDPHAMVIVMPALEAIHHELHDIIVREAKGKKQPEQKVRDNAGKLMGRVPANIGKIFRKLLHERKIQRITCTATGPPTISRKPPSQAKVTSTVASCGATRSYLFSFCNYYYQCCCFFVLVCCLGCYLCFCFVLGTFPFNQTFFLKMLPLLTASHS